VELATELNLPVIIHTREADEDTERILAESSVRRGILHCFTSTRRLAEFVLGRGFLISFSGIVTFPNAKDLAEIARAVPADQLLVETDCPYLAPIPHRGKRNEPSFVTTTAHFLAGVRNVDPGQLAQQTSENFARLFSLGETA
jgi:TatD DNase family protein